MPVIDIVLEWSRYTKSTGRAFSFEVLGREAKGALGIAGRRFFQRGGEVKAISNKIKTE